MSVVFIIPFVPIPRIIKRIDTAYSVDETSVIFWDRGTDESGNLSLPKGVRTHGICENANEGKPLKRIGATFRFCKAAYSILKKENPTCIHVTKTDMLLLVWVYCITKRKRPSIIYEVSDIHDMALNDSKTISKIILKKILYIMEYIGMSIVDRLIVTSESFWSVYYKNMIPKESVIFLPNTPKESIFKKFKNKKSKKFRVGFIGKVRYKEQLKLLIDASEKANVDVLIAGNGIDLEEIREYSKKRNNVTIHGAYNYEKEIASLYSGIDCVYSMYDTKVQNVQIALPNRLYEATLCGLPLIVSKGTELANIVEDKKLGIVVDDQDFKGLVDALIILKNDVTYRATIGENCEKFYQNWKYEVVNQRLTNTYKELT